MAWAILFHDAFEAEFREMARSLQDELLAHAVLLRDFGPGLGWPEATRAARTSGASTSG